MKRKQFNSIIERRISIILLFFFIALGSLLSRLFALQIVYHREYTLLAAKQHDVHEELLAERGLIYATDKNGTRIPLALNQIEKTLVASPKNVVDQEKATEVITKYLPIKKDELIEKLSLREDPYEIIAKRISENDAEKIGKELPRGFFFEDVNQRIYPHSVTASHLLGFVNREEEGRGQYGIERSYEEELSGRKGILEGVKDPAGFFISIGRRIINPPQSGADLLLTIDYNIQLQSEKILHGVKEKWQAVSGEVIVLEPRTGKILALAAEPAFDPNDFAKEKDFSVFLNPAFESSYELGSVMKPITMAGGLEEGVVRPDTTYEDPGELKIGGYKIQNFDGQAHGVQTMTQVLEKSLNTGAVYVARLLGKERQLKYLTQFGFGEKSGIDLPGEVSGNISNLKAGRDIDFATASFGQGIAVTPLQMVTSIAAIANEGTLMRPYVVEKVIDDSGNERVQEPKVVRGAISRDTAETLTKMLVSAVKNGFENRAGVKGYFVAGKTGTAQIPRRDGPGYSDKVIHTFVGYAPAFDPRFLILIQLNEPKGNRFAANTLTPAFHDLAEYILNYYEVPPDEK